MADVRLFLRHVPALVPDDLRGVPADQLLGLALKCLWRKWPRAPRRGRTRKETVMGETAEDVIEGRCCSWCGVYFAGEHGCPVVCQRCARGWPASALRREGLQPASLPEAGAEEKGDEHG